MQPTNPEDPVGRSLAKSIPRSAFNHRDADPDDAQRREITIDHASGLSPNIGHAPAKIANANTPR
jgi:hypothetical protein